MTKFQRVATIVHLACSATYYRTKVTIMGQTMDMTRSYCNSHGIKPSIKHRNIARDYCNQHEMLKLMNSFI